MKPDGGTLMKHKNRPFLSKDVSAFTFLRRLSIGITLWRFATTVSPTALGQATNVTDETSTPIPGAGHDYLHEFSETVNPANGSVSLRLGAPVPGGRLLNVPICFNYDSGGHYEMTGSGPIGCAEYQWNSVRLLLHDAGGTLCEFSKSNAKP
jgi:hypothetical protein